MHDLYPILNQASPEERRGLGKLLDMDGPCNSQALMDRLESQSQSIFGELFGPDREYRGIVRQVADKLDVWYGRFEQTERIETKIAQKVFRTVWEKMTPAQRQQMEEKLQEAAQEFDGEGLGKSTALASLLLAGKLSGFGVYLLASTALGAVTGALGVALPFAVYTTMSSTIAVVLGPVGWIGAGLFVLWKLTGANYKRLIPAILYISMLRAQQQGGDLV